jgi:WXG100 family type VII secretion target
MICKSYARKEVFMPAPIIQGEYDGLADAAKSFTSHADSTNEMVNTLKQCIEALSGGGWYGEASVAFYNEMGDLIFPALQRMMESLNEASSATMKVAQAFQDAEEEAGALFQGDGSVMPGNGQSGSGSQGGGRSPGQIAVESTRPMPPGMTQLTDAGGVPAYMVDYRNLNGLNPEAVGEFIGAQGRPVIFAVHGFNVTPEGAEQNFRNIQARVAEQYAHLPEHERPIVVGVSWDGSNVLGYNTANQNAIPTGQAFGRTLETLATQHPEVSVNVMAHSLGNRVVGEAVNANNVQIDNYLAIQPATERSEYAPGGRYSDVMTSEVTNMTATYTSGDLAMYAHRVAGYDPALGNNAATLPRGNYEAVNLRSRDRWFDLNHYGLDDPRIFNEIDTFTGRAGNVRP